MNDKDIAAMKKIKDALDALQGVKYEEGIGFVSTETKVEKHPDARKHKIISFVKSGMRLTAFYFLAYYDLQLAAIILVLAELLGIAEELV
jgi:hypothetical protein